MLRTLARTVVLAAAFANVVSGRPAAGGHEEETASASADGAVVGVRRARVFHLGTTTAPGFDEAANAAGGISGGGTTCNGKQDVAGCNEIKVFCSGENGKEILVTKQQRKDCPVTCNCCNKDDNCDDEEADVTDLTGTTTAPDDREQDTAEAGESVAGGSGEEIAVAAVAPPTPSSAGVLLEIFNEYTLGLKTTDGVPAWKAELFTTSSFNAPSFFETKMQELVTEFGEEGVNQAYLKYSGLPAHTDDRIDTDTRRLGLFKLLDTNSDDLITFSELKVVVDTAEDECSAGNPNAANMVTALGLFFGFSGFFALFTLLGYLGAEDKLPACMVAVTPTELADKTIGIGQDGAAVATFNLATIGVAQVVACVLTIVPLVDLATRTRPSNAETAHAQLGLVAVVVLLSISQAASLVFLLKRKQRFFAGFLWLSAIFFVVLVSYYNQKCGNSSRGTERAIWAGYVFQLFAALNAWWLVIRLHTLGTDSSSYESEREIELQPSIVSVIQLYLTIFTCQMFCDNVETWAGWSPAVGTNGQHDLLGDRSADTVAQKLLDSAVYTNSTANGFISTTPGQVTMATAFMNLFVVLVPLCMSMQWLLPALICAAFTEIMAFIVGFVSYEGMLYDLAENSRYGWFGGIFGVQDWYMAMIGIFALFILVDVILKWNSKGWSCDGFPALQPEWPLFFGAFSVMVNTLKLVIVIQLFIRSLSLCRRLAPKAGGNGYEIVDDATVMSEGNAEFDGCGSGSTLLALAVVVLVAELLYLLFTMNNKPMAAAGLNAFEAIILIVAGAMAATHTHHANDGLATIALGEDPLLLNANWRVPGVSPNLLPALAEAPANGFAALAWLALGLSLTSCAMFILAWQSVLDSLDVDGVAVETKDPFVGNTDTDPINAGAAMEGGLSGGGCECECDFGGGGGGGGGGGARSRGAARGGGKASTGGKTAARGRRASAAPRRASASAPRASAPRATRATARAGRGKKAPVMNPRAGRAMSLASLPEPEETNDDELYDADEGDAAPVAERYDQDAADELYGPEGDQGVDVDVDDDADGDFSGAGAGAGAGGDDQFGGFGDDDAPPLPGKSDAYGSDNYHDNGEDAPPPVPRRGING